MSAFGSRVSPLNTPRLRGHKRHLRSNAGTLLDTWPGCYEENAWTSRHLWSA